MLLRRLLPRSVWYGRDGLFLNLHAAGAACVAGDSPAWFGRRGLGRAGVPPEVLRALQQRRGAARAPRRRAGRRRQVAEAAGDGLLQQRDRA
eukprot:363309-Chlamydomonas_euryale.AAC.4